MAIESKNLLVWVKAMSRGKGLPLDASEVYESLAEAELYAGTATAYAGQTIKAKLEDGKYHSYVLQPSEAGYVLEEIGAINESDLKQYVQVVDALPESGQIEGVLYIKKTTVENIDSYTDGYIWVSNAWKQVFWDVSADVTAVSGRVTALEGEMANKAPIANPVFTGTVKVGTEEVAVKSYVDGLIANLVSSAPGIVDAENTLPASGYKAGQTFRVAAAGTYAGIKCETGDLIIVVKDHVAETASSDDFMVIQANIDGAVTSTADAATVGEIVVFDSVTGKVIKGSGVQIASLNDAIAKAHEHSNATQLATYDKTQTELLAAAKAEAQGLVTAHETAVNTALDGKADKATTLSGYGITDAYNKTEIDNQLKTITDNLNTKITGADVDTKIAAAKTEFLGDAADAAATALEERVGSIPADTTIQAYIDTAVGSGGTASAQAIATAKQEAINTSKSYTDTQLSAALTVVEF
jgi:hypothetical protein